MKTSKTPSALTQFRPPVVPHCDLPPGSDSELFDKLLKEREGTIAQVAQNTIASSSSSSSSSSTEPSIKEKKSKELDLPRAPMEEVTLGGFNPLAPDVPDFSMKGGFDVSNLFGEGATAGLLDRENLTLEHVNEFMGVTEGFNKYPDGATYMGKYFDDQPHGLGQMMFANGDMYEGDFYEGKIEGKGKMTFRNGDFYEGEFSKGQINGIGRLELTSGLCFEGQFKDGIPEVLEDYHQEYAKQLRSARKAKDVSQRLFAIAESMRLEVCKKAIAAFRDSFEANRRALIESKLTPQQIQERELKKKQEIERAEKERELMIQKLVEEEEKAAAAKRKTAGNNKEKGKKPLQTPTVVSSSSSSSGTNNNKENGVNESTAIKPAVQKMSDPIKSSPPKKLVVHARVTRWETTDVEVMRGFVDYREGELVKQYEHMSPQQLKIQRMRHHLPDLWCILGLNNKGVYWNEAPRGARVMAALVVGGQEAEYGDVSLGFDEKKRVIFHQKFDKWPGTKTDYKRLSQPIEETTEKNPPEAGWEPVGSCTWQILANRVIEFVFFNKQNKSEEIHRLRVFPQN